MSNSITELMTQDEGKTLEFKRDASSPKPRLKSLIAFSNSAGGRLIIGVNDEKRPVGVASPLDEEERLCNLIADSISPRLVPNIEIESPGILLSGLTIEDMKQSTSGIRNHESSRPAFRAIINQAYEIIQPLKPATT